MEENTSQKHSHEIAIALIQKDIEYIKKSSEKTATNIELMDKNFARRDEMTSILTTLTTISNTLEKKADHADIFKALSLKVDTSEFEPIQKTLSRINWILISSVIVGLMALLVNANK